MNETKTIAISAYDMLFFGAGRPFTMEDESWTRGVFPPNPSTIYGYLRSSFFERNMKELQKATNNDDPTINFNIHHFCLSLIETKDRKTIQTQYYPIPYGHLLVNDSEIKPLKLKEHKNPKNNFTHILISKEKGKIETLDNTYYVSKENLELFLNGKDINTDKGFTKITDSLTPEERIGIAKDLRLGKTAEGKLYRIEFNHLSTINFSKKTQQEIQFLLKIEANVPDSNYMRNLGGEGKKAFINSASLDEVTEPSLQNVEAILYFTTPAIFKLSKIETYATIQTVANDNPEYIGGWDMVKRKPKPMRKAYPAGTVFYLKFKNKNSIKEFKQKFNNNKIGEKTKEGFGQFFLGNQKKIKL